MGGVESAPDNDGPLVDVIGAEAGFRVHRVEPNSPGANAGLISILDYIVVADGVRLDVDDGTFPDMIRKHKGKPMRLCIFNTHTLRTREAVLVPDDSWGGNGLLGVTIRFDVARPLEKHTLHVLDVYAGGPADAAKLDAFNDYILGVGDLLFDGPDEFGELVSYNCDRAIRLYVYNAKSESVREVSIVPKNDWGGAGLLGCGVGSGYLHSLPRRREILASPLAPAEKVPTEPPVEAAAEAARPAASESAFAIATAAAAAVAVPAAAAPVEEAAAPVAAPASAS